VAYIRRLPSGKFNAIVRLPNGKRKSITDPLKRVVAQKAAELEAAIRHGGTGVVVDRRLDVAGWAAKWFAARKVEPNTAVKNASHWKNHVKPQWGSWPLHAIDRLDVQTWVNAMEKAGVGASTVHASYNLLSKMLSDAVLSKKLHASPCVEITLPTVVPPVERWLTPHEYDRIQLALANRTLRVPRTDRTVPDPLAPMWQALVALGCYSGLRFPAEVGTLLWRWVGVRDSGPVFIGARGERVTELAIRRVWRAALEEAGVEYVDPYSMRHTCSSWLAQAGVSSDEIADILGHSSTRMMGVYRHMRPGVHDRVRAAWASSSLPLDEPLQRLPNHG
jgi:integrase